MKTFIAPFVYGQIRVLQPYDLPVTKGVGGMVPLCGESCGLVPEKMEKEKEKRELRSPDGTEPDTADGVARVADDAQRATANDGVDGPAAAAQQTIRARLGSCGVGHAS